MDDVLYPEQALAISLGAMYIAGFFIAHAVDAMFLLIDHVDEILADLDQHVIASSDRGDR